MARVNNLSNFLTDVASAIKTKKGSETAIPAANFDTEILALPSQGVYQTKVITINENGQTVITPDSGYDAMDGVQVTTNVPEKQLQTKSYDFTTNQTIELSPDTGYDGFDSVVLTINVPTIDTSDATATASDIASGKTAYVNGGKVTGNIPSAGSTDIMVDDANLNVTVNRGYDVVQAIYRNRNKMIYNTDHTMTQNIKFSQLATLGNITANKIVSGNTIFGVVGTGGGGGGSGDIKLFETEQTMQADPSPSEGDLAVVYRSEIQPIQKDSEFSSCIFPQTVILDEAFTGSIYGRFRSTGSSYFDGRVNMSSSVFRFSGYGDTGEVMVQYTSQDGITYTRTDGGEELQEFGTTIKWENRGNPFNSVIGNFMKIGDYYYGGLYQYASYSDTENYLVISDPKATMSNSIWKAEANIVDEISVGVCNKIKQLLTSMIDGTLNTFLVEKIDDNHFKSYVCSDGNYHYGAAFIQDADNSNNVYIGSYIGLDGASIRPISIYDIDISTDTISLNTTITDFTLLKDIRNNTSEYIPTQLITNTNRKFVLNDNLAVNVTSTTFGKEEVLYKFVFPTKYKYLPAPNQLTAVAEDVYGTDFMGKNGAETGTLTTNISSTFDDKNAEVYSKIMQAYDDMSPMILTDDNKEISKSIKLIPVKSNGEPLLDTSNVTNMNNMFYGCTSLTTIPQLNTSKVTDMGMIFDNCTSLTTISLLDTSNVTNMSSMLNGCTNLTTIPLLDTSNATNMNSMFYSCTSLTTIPQLNTSKVTDMGMMFYNCTSLTTISLLDTSNVTNMYYMFYNCTSLTTIPQLNTSKVTNMGYMFQNCTSLQEIDLSGGTINSSASHNGIFYNVPTTCVIYVKDQASKTLLESWDNTHTYTIKTI